MPTDHSTRQPVAAPETTSHSRNQSRAGAALCGLIGGLVGSAVSGSLYMAVVFFWFGMVQGAAIATLLFMTFWLTSIGMGGAIYGALCGGALPFRPSATVGRALVGASCGLVVGAVVGAIMGCLLGTLLGLLVFFVPVPGAAGHISPIWGLYGAGIGAACAVMPGMVLGAISNAVR